MIAKILARLAGLSPQKTLIGGVVLALVYYMTMYNDGSAIETQIQTLQTSIQEEEKKSQETDAALREVEQVRVTVGALSEQFKTVSQALPTDISMSDIIRAVDAISRSSGVSIKSKEPRPVVNREYYEEIPLKITMEGNYSEVTLFLYYLASTERIMKANNFTITQPSLNDKVTPGRLLFEGQVVSYRFIDNKDAKGGEAAAPGVPGQ